VFESVKLENAVAPEVPKKATKAAAKGSVVKPKLGQATQSWITGTAEVTLADGLVTAPGDSEISALDQAFHALEPLDRSGRARAIRYLVSRLDVQVSLFGGFA
jgi:hypothetical protein